MAQNNQKSGYPVQRPVVNLVNPGQPQGGYAPYPTQSNLGYPTQQFHQPPFNQQYPQQYPQVNQQAGYGHLYSPYGQPGYGTPPPPYPGAVPNQNVSQPMIQGSFDSGARFGTGVNPVVPPPPPGVMPNQAQMAAASGQSVVMQHPKAGWVEGSRGGGYTFW